MMLNVSHGTSSCVNFLSSRTEFSEVHSLIAGVISLTLAPATLFTNIILVVNLQKTKQIPNPSRTFLFFLSYSDCCIGGIVLPIFALTLLFYSNERNCVLEMVSQFASGLFCGISGRVTGFIALDRFIHIKHYFMHQKLNSNKQYRILICISSVLLSLATSITVSFGTRFGFYRQACAVIISFDTLTLGCAILLYLAAYRSIRNHVRHSVVWNANNQNRRRPKYDLVMAKTITIVLLVLCLCYGPFVATNLFQSLYRNGEALVILNLWSFVLLFMNSTLNASVFLYKHRNRRRSSSQSLQARCNEGQVSFRIDSRLQQSRSRVSVGAM